ncbi:MAG: CAP domain-containing protein, partial [Acidimicrobiales bacterium]
IVGMASTSKGDGYWLVAADGGIFAFGKAKFFGSAGGTRLARPVVGIRADSRDRGYLLVAADGGTFAYGSVKFQGSLGGLGINNIVSAAPMPNQGYALLSSTSRLYVFPSKGAVSITREQRIAEEVFDSINAERAKRGIPLLKWDPSLSETAALWSANMAAAGFRHTNMTTLGSQLGSRYNALSENIYWGTGSLADSGSAHTSFMGSASHRDALLNTGYTSLGIGVYCTSDGKLFVTEQFGNLKSQGSPTFSGATPSQPVARPSAAGISCT